MNQRERAIAIVAGGVVGLLTLDSLLVSPLLARLDDAEARVAMAQRELGDASTLLSREVRDRRRWRDIAGGSILEEQMLAEGQLLNAAPAWAGDAGLTLTSIKPERTESEHGFGKVTVRLTAAGDLESVSRFLYAVQTADLPVRVADLTIASRGDDGAQLNVQVGLSTIYREPADDAEGGAS